MNKKHAVLGTLISDIADRYAETKGDVVPSLPEEHFDDIEEARVTLIDSLIYLEKTKDQWQR